MGRCNRAGADPLRFTVQTRAVESVRHAGGKGPAPAALRKFAAQIYGSVGTLRPARSRVCIDEIRKIPAEPARRCES
jgi:hypothetical protein